MQILRPVGELRLVDDDERVRRVVEGDGFHIENIFRHDPASFPMIDVCSNLILSNLVCLLQGLFASAQNFAKRR